MTFRRLAGATAGTPNTEVTLPRFAALLAVGAAVVLALMVFMGSSAPKAMATPDPVGCTTDVAYDPAIPTFKQVMDANGVANNTLGGFSTGTTNRHITSQLYAYMDALVAATASNPRVKVISKTFNKTELGQFRGPSVGIAGEDGRLHRVWIVGTPANIDNIENDQQFWNGVRTGEITEAQAKTTANYERPSFAWIQETPHGDEPQGGEATLRLGYELAARTDCHNLRRLSNIDTFLRPASNPDGRDNNVRTSAWSFDPNRDTHIWNQDMDREMVPDAMTKYPPLFNIDMHGQSGSTYFFPPYEDPLHHEFPKFGMNFIQKVIGPTLQARFNDQSGAYQNYNTYDLFVPDYTDSSSWLLTGSGNLFEKGSGDSYGKQVYDHFMAADLQLDITSDLLDKNHDFINSWIHTWTEATQQGQDCVVQENTIGSILHQNVIPVQPDINICGYYYKPGFHTGQAAEILKNMQRVGVHVYQLDQPVTVTGAHDFANTYTSDQQTTTQTLPVGTYWIPNAQSQKHWINAVLEEAPWNPYDYYYDKVSWSFSLLQNMAGNGQLQQQMPANTAMHEIPANHDFSSAPVSSQPIYAFSTDSMQAMGMIIALQHKGATVYRAKAAFDSGGVHFPTGAALVDGGTVSLSDVQASAADFQTPVIGMSSYPGDRYLINTPKIALYAGASIPSNPINGGGTGQCGSTAFCEMYFSLTQQAKIPLSDITPVTAADLAANVLTTGNYTALVNPNAAAIATTSEVQRIMISAMSGTFTLTFNGQTTVPLQFNAAASGTGGVQPSVQNALNALSSIAPGSVTVGGGVGNIGGTTPYTITFSGGNLAGNQPQTTLDSSLLTGGSASSTATTTTEGNIGTALPLQTFVNNGGIYVGDRANGLNSARNAGITNLNSKNSAVAPDPWNATACPASAGGGTGIQSPGSTYDTKQDVTNPVAWSFDRGAHIYRESDGNTDLNLRNDTLSIPGSGIPAATAAFSYADDLTYSGHYSYQCNTILPGQLPGRPVVVDQPFGAGHAVIMGFDTGFRGWVHGETQMVMNAMLYPTGVAIPPAGPRSEGSDATASQPIPKAKLPKVASRPVHIAHDPGTDVVLRVKAKLAKRLRAAVRAAKLPADARAKVTYKRTGKRGHRFVTLRIRGEFDRRDIEFRPAWGWRLIEELNDRKVWTSIHSI